MRRQGVIVSGTSRRITSGKPKPPKNNGQSISVKKPIRENPSLEEVVDVIVMSETENDTKEALVEENPIEEIKEIQEIKIEDKLNKLTKKKKKYTKRNKKVKKTIEEIIEVSDPIQSIPPLWFEE